MPHLPTSSSLPVPYSSAADAAMATPLTATGGTTIASRPVPTASAILRPDEREVREDAEADVLARAPACVDAGDLDAGHAEVGEGPEAGHRYARLDKAHQAVEAVEPDGAEDVGHRSGNVFTHRDEEDDHRDDVRWNED